MPTPAVLPADEPRRLQSLYETLLLDTQPEARFDRVVRDAATTFEVDSALFTLVDAHRQWFKSRHNWSAAQTSRDIAFCAHTILEADILVVEDALQDARFLTNPLVTGQPGIRFYAGAPVLTLDGSAIGTLCLIDSKPRTFNAAERAQLLELRDRLTAALLVDTEL